MRDRNRESVPGSWSLVRERTLTTGHCSEEWYSEHSVPAESGAAGKECKDEVLKGGWGLDVLYLLEFSKQM